MLNPNFALLNLSYVNLLVFYEYKVNKINRNYEIIVRLSFNGSIGVIGYADSEYLIVNNI